MATPETIAQRFRQAIGIEVLLAGLVLLVFVGVRDFAYSAAALPEADYQRSVILPALFEHPRSLILVILVLVASVRLRRRRIGEVDGILAVRVVACVAAGAIGLAFSLYDYNAWFGQWHTWDRLVLAALAVGVVWSLAAIPAFVTVAIVIVSQFQFPIGSYSWTDKRVIFDVLIVAVTVLVLLPACASVVRVVWLCWLILLGGWYVHAGLGKLNLGWQGRNHLENLFVHATRSYGWLDLDPSVVYRIAGFLADVGPVLRWGALAIELGVVLLVWDRRVGALWSGALIMLHATIFLASGIFFWKWILVLGAMIVILVKQLDDHVLDPIYRPGPAVLAGIAMVAAVSLWSVQPLAWIDSPLATRYVLEAHHCNGEVSVLGPGAFGPYRLVFAQERFGFMTSEPRVVDTYGAVDSVDEADALEAVSTPEATLDVIERLGDRRFDPVRTERFDGLVRRFIATGGSRSVPLLGALAPQHILGSASMAPRHPSSPVTRVDVVVVTVRWDGAEPVEVRRIPAHEISIADC